MWLNYRAGLSAAFLVIVGASLYLLNWLQPFPSVFTSSEHNADASAFIAVDTDTGELMVARDETTVAQWLVCVSDNGCPPIASDENSHHHPKTGVNWRDVTAYLSWYTKRFNTPVRLPSREEWIVLAADHAPREKQKLFDDPRLAWAADYDLTAVPQSRVTEPTGAFGSNQFGINDLTGNVWEWTSSCQQGIPGLPMESFGCVTGRYAMGNHAAILSERLRIPGNSGCGGGQPPANVGFRLVKM